MPKVKKNIILDGKSIPCRDVTSIRLVCKDGMLMSEFIYQIEGETVTTLLPREAGNRLELIVRKACK